MKLIKITILLFLLFSSQMNFSQTISGAKQLALSYSDFSISKNTASLFCNPSGSSFLKSTEINISYTPSPFGIKELATGYGAIIQPTKFGNFGFGFQMYGFDLYKENQFAISYSNLILEKINFGISINYNIVNIKNYGNDSEFNISFGSIYDIHEQISLGFVVKNPLRFTHSKMELPTIYSFGVIAKPIDNAELYFSLIKEFPFTISYNLGFEYSLLQSIYLRSGFQTEPKTYSGGIGIRYNLLQIDYGISSHQYLGLTNQIGILFNF